MMLPLMGFALGAIEGDGASGAIASDAVVVGVGVCAGEEAMVGSRVAPLCPVGTKERDTMCAVDNVLYVPFKTLALRGGCSLSRLHRSRGLQAKGSARAVKSDRDMALI